MTQWADSSLERLAELWVVKRDLYASDSSLSAMDLFVAVQGGLPAFPEELPFAAGERESPMRSGWAQRVLSTSHSQEGGGQCVTPGDFPPPLLGSRSYT